MIVPSQRLFSCDLYIHGFIAVPFEPNDLCLHTVSIVDDTLSNTLARIDTLSVDKDFCFFVRTPLFEDKAGIDDR